MRQTESKLNMTTKEKLAAIRLETKIRHLNGYKNPIGDSGRQLKAEVYRDILRRHPKAIESGRFQRVVRAVNSLIAA